MKAKRLKNTSEPEAKKQKTEVDHDVAKIKDTANSADKKQKGGRVSFQKLGSEFYDVPCERLAKGLLGKVLVRRLDNGTVLKGTIVETECYPGGDDKASATYNGKVTPKNTPLYMKPGTTWVYMTYGMYHCMNISSQGHGSAVLLRAVDPIAGMDFMNTERLKKRKSKKDIELKKHELCSGPSKLCMSFNINIANCNSLDLSLSESLWIEDDGTLVGQDDIITTTRIGIDGAGKEWAMKPYRFYVYGNKSVSKCDPAKEREKDKKV